MRRSRPKAIARLSAERALRMGAAHGKALSLARLFEETPEYKKVLWLFDRKRIVTRAEINRACPGAFEVFSNIGLLSGKGGQNYALSNTGLILHQKFPPANVK